LLFYPYSKGFLDGKSPVPFRLTRNIEEFVGSTFLNGVFIPAIASAASALCSKENQLESAFHLLMRDDIVAWYFSKSSQREGTQRSVEDVERQLGDRVSKNVALVRMRLRDCAPSESRSSDHGSALDDKVLQLVRLATAEENLAAMPLTYCAWI